MGRAGGERLRGAFFLDEDFDIARGERCVRAARVWGAVCVRARGALDAARWRGRGVDGGACKKNVLTRFRL